VIQMENALPTGEVLKLRAARDILGRPIYFTAAYWVDGLLIDTGCAHTAGQFLRALEGRHVEQVVNTHSHEDHIGANAAIQAAFGCPIYAHPEALRVLQNPRLQPLQPYRRLFWGWPRPSEGQAVDQQLETDRFRFEVIDTPGHSPDHICLFEPQQGWLFSGDTYIGGQDRALREGYDIYGIIASLKKLARLPVQAIFAGSGSVRQMGIEPLRQKIDYLEDLGQRVQSLHSQGLSERQIRRQLLGPEMPIAYVTQGHFSGLHLVRSYLAAVSPG
jgi:glyoxylase-like metal-dependent hydrolase (beta-lactamase superfamily II)